MNDVKVNVTIPKQVYLFTSRLAALEDSTVEKWIEYWIMKEFQCIVDNDFIVDEFDSVKMRELYVLKKD